MPRRRVPDPFALKVGRRIKQLREEQDLTMERLAFESELGSKGHLSNIERGLTRPTIHTLKIIADRLEVDVMDLVNFPEESERHKLVARTRKLGRGTLRKLLRETEPAEEEPKPKPSVAKKTTKRRRASGAARKR